MDSFLRHLREAQDQRFEETLEEDAAATGTLLVGSLHGHAASFDTTGPTRGILTIDLDLPPVDAAPKHKGPRWRLQVLREWTPEGAEERRRARQATVTPNLPESPVGQMPLFATG